MGGIKAPHVGSAKRRTRQIIRKRLLWRGKLRIRAASSPICRRIRQDCYTLDICRHTSRDETVYSAQRNCPDSDWGTLNLELNSLIRRHYFLFTAIAVVLVMLVVGGLKLMAPKQGGAGGPGGGQQASAGEQGVVEVE